jgi:hypothetical protein
MNGSYGLKMLKPGLEEIALNITVRIGPKAENC